MTLITVVLMALILFSLLRIQIILAGETQLIREQLSEISEKLQLGRPPEYVFNELMNQLSSIEDHLSLLRRNEEQKRREAGSAEIEPDPDNNFNKLFS